MKRGMKMLKSFIYALLGYSVLTILVHAQQDQADFISIDCGIEEGPYTDEITGIKYVSDSNFIDTGESKDIASEYKSDSLDEEYSDVRSFPEGTRNCYTLKPARGKNYRYLIRARFLYGNYDGKGIVPEFNLYLGVNFWDTVKLEQALSLSTKEIIHIPSRDYIHVCLVNTGSGTPFISALELRLLNNKTYEAEDSKALSLYTRLDLGSRSNETVRYNEDVYDRIWWSYTDGTWAELSTSLHVDSAELSTSLHVDSQDDLFQPPSTILMTASTPKNSSDSLTFDWEVADSTAEYYIYLHFAELQILQANESRKFNIYQNDKLWYGPLVPRYLQADTISSTGPLNDGGKNIVFTLNKTGNATLPPILNGIEIYMVKDMSKLQTNEQDVDAIMDIKSIYGVKRNWQGDPCVPEDYRWNGLECNNDADDPPEIISMYLSSSGLTGNIAPAISKLTSLKTLDLSNNSLSGPVPEFLSQLQSLTFLNLSGNNLTGFVPVKLIEKSDNGFLTLSVDDQNLCPSAPCNKASVKKKSNSIIPVVASIAAILVLLVATFFILWIIRRRKKQDRKVEAESNEKRESTELKNQQFTYPDVLRITNNFERVLGKGGFGTVYHGYVDDIPVAVKMLSPSSTQGYKQFQAEVKILMRVYHQNLTTLVGYCNEGTNMGLIYEYMANGNLQRNLSDQNAYVLSWENRLKIAAGAAQGLEYLHSGCKPPIIHRDVKSTNILLNENFQAKLADFGLSRTFNPLESNSHESTFVAGTPGYLDPEYYETHLLNAKSDVYSFGIVLLEIITSRPVIVRSHEKAHIIEWVSSMLIKGEINKVVDSRLHGNFNINSVWKAVEIAMACVSKYSANRPTMNYVVMELKECLATEIARVELKDSSEIIKTFDTEMTPRAR